MAPRRRSIGFVARGLHLAINSGAHLSPQIIAPAAIKAAVFPFVPGIGYVEAEILAVIPAAGECGDGANVRVGLE